MKLGVIILAAGLGTRMKTSTPKVLHRILGKPMLSYIIETAQKLKPVRIVVVTHPMQHQVHDLIAHHGAIKSVQRKMLGTADAVKTGLKKIGRSCGTVLVVNGDTPLIQAGTLKSFIGKFSRSRAEVSVLSFHAENPFSYGRIIRDQSGRSLCIVEQNDLDENQHSIKEVNSGVYAFKRSAEKYINRISINKRKSEYYLTDIVAFASRDESNCKVFQLGDESEFYGVNTLKDLLTAEKLMQKRIVEKFMLRGVRFLDEISVIIHSDVRIDRDTVISPNVSLREGTRIGKGCIIHHGASIKKSILGANVTVLEGSVINSSTIGGGSVIGPYAHLRPGSKIGKFVKIGNFVEIKNSFIADHSKASHLSYIGDATVGKNVNIGAGTITCNYDGRNKYHTFIEDGVFVGSDSQLIAPVRIGKNAFIAAGSTITKNVLPESLAISRTDQQEIADWAKSKRKRRKK